MREGITLSEGRHYGVGPVSSGPEHSVLNISTVYDHEPADVESNVFVCYECGLVSEDKRRFAVEDCDRDENPIPESLRERVEKDGVLP